MAYNGWTNYETWAVALWIDNEPGSYEERRDLARRARSAYDLAGSLKSWMTDAAPDLGATLWADLLGAALSEVNWQEIAENWYEEEHPDEDDAEDDGEDAEAEPARANGEDA
jgi:hypothetical protein